MRFPGIRLLVFAKAPVPGQVKTRLLPVLDATGAAELHARLVEESIARFTAESVCPVELHCAPDAEHPLFRALVRRYPIQCQVQQGRDLGERMGHAVDQTLADGHWPLLVGTDCPRLDAGVLVEACEVLAAGHNTVLGPAEDGGYVLLGLRQPAPELFQDMAWGTDRVLAATRQRLAERGWDWRELPSLWDLDRPEDLLRYQAMG
ncbi:MAG: TIGR04282 family arsenosugar biosynthesis glycosyltransferase [Xanthomonadaceae bacterium]|nr:TIGR04282 family arsenosugar biosynthesis glycosyltransferase [Xanthomonadaceae bacterium]